MLLIILIVIYIIGVIIWMKIEKKYFPYEKGDYTIEFDGAHKITPEIYNCNVQARVGKTQPFGTIIALTGRKITFDDEPIKI